MGRPANLQIKVTSDSQQARGDIAGMESSVTSSLGKLKTAGPAAAAAAAAAIGAAFAAAVGRALDQSKIVGKLGAQLGATPAEAGRLGRIAGKLYGAGVTGEFQTAADAIAATMRSGLLPTGATETHIQQLSTKVADLANVFDEDLGQVTRAVSQMLRTGLAGSAQEAFDVLTKGLQNGSNAAGDLLDTFIEYSTQFRDMGISGPMAMGLIQQGLQGGARDADVAADAFKELNIRIQSQEAADALQKLGFNAKDMAEKFTTGGPPAAASLDLLLDRLRMVKDPAEKSALAVSLLGTQAEDLSKALFAMDPSTAVAALGAVEGGSDRLATSLRDNAGAAFDSFKQNAEQKMVNFISENVIPVLLKLHSWFNDKVMPAAKELGRVYADYLGPILATLRDGLQRVAEKIQANRDKWEPLWQFIKDHVIPLISQFASGALGRLIDVMLKLLDVTFWITDQLGDMINTVKRAIDWLSQLKPPGWISGFIDSISSFGATSFSGTLSTTNRTLATPERFAARATATRAVGPHMFSGQTRVYVTIDGQQLQGRITRSISSALNAEGARYLARGWS